MKIILTEKITASNSLIAGRTNVELIDSLTCMIPSSNVMSILRSGVLI